MYGGFYLNHWHISVTNGEIGTKLCLTAHDEKHVISLSFDMQGNTGSMDRRLALCLKTGAFSAPLASPRTTQKLSGIFGLNERHPACAQAPTVAKLIICTH